MGTVSQLPEKIRTIAPIIVSEAEAFDGVHTLIRQMSHTNDGYALNRSLSPLFPAIAGSGLLGITIPSEGGGADVSNIVLGEIVLSAAVANSAAAALLASHFYSVELLRGSGATAACDYFYGRALAGDLFLMIGDTANAPGPGDVHLVPESGKPGWRLNGALESAIDPIHADWLVVRISDEAGEHTVFVPRMTAGLRLTPDRVSFSNVHVDADCCVAIADCCLSTGNPLDTLLQSAQKLGWAERELNDRLARHRRSHAQDSAYGVDYLSSLGLIVSRIESGKAALERAGRKLDTAQVNTDVDTVANASFAAAIALSSAAEAFDLACEAEPEHQQPVWTNIDPYGHAPIGARLLENSIH